MNTIEIQQKLQDIVVDALKLDIASRDISIDQPFFSNNPDNPGLIGDSLAVLEIASRISEEFNILPGDISEDAYQDIRVLSVAIDGILNGKVEAA
jgi:acyl carrier protein